MSDAPESLRVPTPERLYVPTGVLNSAAEHDGYAGICVSAFTEPFYEDDVEYTRSQQAEIERLNADLDTYRGIANGAEAEIERLKAFIARAFDAHPNLDLDIAALEAK